MDYNPYEALAIIRPFLNEHGIDAVIDLSLDGGGGCHATFCVRETNFCGSLTVSAPGEITALSQRTFKLADPESLFELVKYLKRGGG